MDAILESFRRWGYLQAQLDPLERLKPVAHPELDGVDHPARQIYCRSIGAEFMHIADPERCRWVAERMESTAAEPQRNQILERLIRAETFEQVSQTRYLGAKRYSLEGATALIPLLDQVLDGAAGHGAERVVMAMSHRGRLNVMVNILNKNPAEIFAEFEDVDPRSILGGGDVKYHIGATGDWGKIHIHLVSNPSHLETVNPVAMGRARAWQTRLGERGRAAVLPITLHGDAGFAGQGIVAETLNMAGLPGYTVSGTIHVIVNNLIGFTTEPRDLHSSRFASDMAKRVDIPIFHLNGEDPDAVVRVSRLALEYRYQFGSDVLIDLIGFRRHGHSEVDDPTITQPLLYKTIHERPPLWKSYARQIGQEKEAEEKQRSIRQALDQKQEEAKTIEAQPVLRQLPSYWDNFQGGPHDPGLEVDTGVSFERLQEITARLTTAPDHFKVHSKIERLLQERREMGAGKRPVDWGMAEALAFGSLLWEGVRVRLSGEDSRRGTFNQRHSVLVDFESAAEYVPLANLHAQQGTFEVYDSPLSENGPLGFEYGFSRDFPEALVLWEAQFGDFANGGQVVIDQFVSATEDKWGLLSGLVMLLPHGFEGQGPEHSSARLERFLQLCGEDNMQVCYPSTAAQYFHLLRRQALQRWRKPLVVLTPKSLLRHPQAVSELEDFSAENFRPVIPEIEITKAKRVLVCSGKIGHELRAERERRKDRATAVVTVEQLYPFPQQELAAELERHSSARDLVWVQEEPANMGALTYILPRLEELAGKRHVRSVKRSASASPATGSMKAHAIEQAALLALAFGASAP